jgi:hypothetical protein
MARGDVAHNEAADDQAMLLAQCQEGLFSESKVWVMSIHGTACTDAAPAAVEHARLYT